MKNNEVLITVSGKDRPGITADLLSIIENCEEKVMDMGQSVTHGLLSLSILINLQKGTEAHTDHEVIKNLLFETKKLNLNFDYQFIEEEGGLELKGEKYILHCVSNGPIATSFLKEVAQHLSNNNVNIQRIDNVSPGRFKSLEIAAMVPHELNRETFKTDLLKISNKHLVDMALIRDNVFRKSKRLVVLDMDSTLIQVEVIDEIAKLAGVGELVEEITEKAMNGEIDYEQSLLQRVEKLKGLKVEDLLEVRKNISLTPGARDFIKKVKQLGTKIALISGGLSFFSDYLKEELDLDYAFSNQLEIVDGAVTGKLLGPIVNADQKAIILNLLAQQEKISLEQVVAIGDGANDLPMLSAAGLGVAFHAKDVVNDAAEHHLGHGPMTNILYFLGIPEER
jgi:phosphoserine phosphatase